MSVDDLRLLGTASAARGGAPLVEEQAVLGAGLACVLAVSGVGAASGAGGGDVEHAVEDDEVVVSKAATVKDTCGPYSEILLPISPIILALSHSNFQANPPKKETAHQSGLQSPTPTLAACLAKRLCFRLPVCASSADGLQAANKCFRWYV